MTQSPGLRAGALRPQLASYNPRLPALALGEPRWRPVQAVPSPPIPLAPGGHPRALLYGGFYKTPLPRVTPAVTPSRRGTEAGFGFLSISFSQDQLRDTIWPEIAKWHRQTA